MNAGLAVSSVMHVLAGVLLFFLVAKFEVPTPREPPHVDIELEHGEGYRSNPGSSAEDPPGNANQGEPSPPPPPAPSSSSSPSPSPSPQPGQISTPSETPTDAADAARPEIEQPPVQPEAEPIAPPKADPQPAPAPPKPPAKPIPPPQAQPARNPDPPTPRPSQPTSAPAPPAPPHPNAELEVHLGDGVGQSVLRDGNRPSQPEATNGLPPYPAYAQSRGMQGKVVLRMQVGSNGTVLSAEIIQSSGYPLLDATAQSWVVRTYRFKPALLDGRPVAEPREQAFIFVLEAP